MTSKPTTISGYGPAHSAEVRATCLYIATKLGDLLDEVVVVGGLAPYLLVDQDNLPKGSSPHAGTMDLDMGLALAMLDQQRYRELAKRLRDAEFSPDVNDKNNPTLQTWITSTSPFVRVDFLIPPTEDSPPGGKVIHIEHDMAAIVTPGLDLAFEDHRTRELSGRILTGARATRRIPVCGPGAFTVLKALAFGNRTENKDAYDLFYVWRGVGIPEVAKCLASLGPTAVIDEALSVIKEDFCDHDRPGPIGAAWFITGGLNDDVQADVVGYARQLLRTLGRL